ncbi:CrcB-like protein-domain-containing protein [Rhizophagus clarus]|uniref:CrcB-like protein-domain-containing protein n=1 Tax=Rhizophagus clarus TaxID=94130 RepID=A0A8H3M1D8_9GLOM|nr:CrcB-like protein-domain-containing protein [Rhizophagus clarus]
MNEIQNSSSSSFKSVDDKANKNNTNISLEMTTVAIDKNVEENDDFGQVVQYEENKELKSLSTAELKENKAIVLSILIPFSIIGALIRIGLNTLHSYPGSPVFSLIYPQFVGCVIMGFCLARKGFIMESYLPLYIGLTTGLCGNLFYRFLIVAILAALADIGITLGMSITGLKIGEHIADIIIRNRKTHSVLHIVEEPFKLNELIIPDFISIGIGVVSIVLVVTLSSTVQVNRSVLFAVVFAPIGALTRWYLSKYNAMKKSFPWGTFAANMSGSVIIGILFLLSNGIASSNISCEIIKGLIDGFCGCLTTISTFATEINITLPRKHAYRYAFISILMGQIAMILTIGIYHWIVGLTTTCPA